MMSFLSVLGVTHDHNAMYITGWPVKHGREFLVPCIKWLHCTMYMCSLENSLFTRYKKHTAMYNYSHPVQNKMKHNIRYTNRYQKDEISFAYCRSSENMNLRKVIFLGFGSFLPIQFFVRGQLSQFSVLLPIFAPLRCQMMVLFKHLTTISLCDHFWNIWNNLWMWEINKQFDYYYPTHIARFKGFSLGTQIISYLRLNIGA